MTLEMPRDHAMAAREGTETVPHTLLTCLPQDWPSTAGRLLCLRDLFGSERLHAVPAPARRCPDIPAPLRWLGPPDQPHSHRRGHPRHLPGLGTAPGPQALARGRNTLGRWSKEVAHNYTTTHGPHAGFFSIQARPLPHTPGIARSTTRRSSSAPLASPLQAADSCADCAPNPLQPCWASLRQQERQPGGPAVLAPAKRGTHLSVAPRPSAAPLVFPWQSTYR